MNRYDKSILVFNEAIPEQQMKVLFLFQELQQPEMINHTQYQGRRGGVIKVIADYLFFSKDFYSFSYLTKQSKTEHFNEMKLCYVMITNKAF